MGQDGTGRVLVTVAHPDDETFGTGSLLAHATARGWTSTVWCATRGEAGTPASGSGLQAEDLPRVREAARQLRADPELAPLLAEWANLHLVEFVSRFHRVGELPEYLQGPARPLVEQRVRQMQAAGQLGETRTERGSCMLHVPFERRYGRDRAECLRGHGDWGHGESH